VVTALDGTFCIQPESQAEVGSVRIEANGFEAVEFPLQEQAARTGLELTYTPHVVDLGIERPESVTARHPRTDPSELELVLEGPERSLVLAHSAPSESGQTDLSFSPSELNAPGVYSIYVRQGAEKSTPRTLLVRAKVNLELIDVTRERGALHVTLATSAQGALVQSGQVELTLDPHRILSSELESGRAHLEVPRGDNPFQASFSYVPLSPEYLAGAPLRLDIPKRESLFPAWSVHALLLILFLFWFRKRWRRRSNAAPGPNEVVESIALEPEEHPLPGVRGTVVDAHTQEPQVCATVTLLSLSASGESSLGQTNTDQAGRFTLLVEADPGRPLAVRVEQKGYRSLRGTVTRGLLRIQLIEQRRGALMDLVRWARGAGSGWREARAPTPLEVARQSHAEGRSERGIWAEQVNVEAFGADSPSPPSETPPPQP